METKKEYGEKQKVYVGLDGFGSPFLSLSGDQLGALEVRSINVSVKNMCRLIVESSMDSRVFYDRIMLILNNLGVNE